MTASPAMQPLFAARPWNVEVLAYEPYDSATLPPFRRRGGYDLAFVPGDNRYGWFARAVGARWVVGFSGDRPAYKNRLLDEPHDYPPRPDAWADMAAALMRSLGAKGRAGPRAAGRVPSNFLLDTRACCRRI